MSLALTISVAGVATAENKLNFAWPVNVGTLNPHLYTPNQMMGQNMVYEPLVRYMVSDVFAPHSV